MGYRAGIAVAANCLNNCRMPTIIPEVVSQHAEEAAFLWLLRDNAIGAPHYDSTDLQRLDNRVEAHLDGLRVAGDPGWDIVWKQAEERPEAGELFAAGVLALESGDAARIDNVLSLAATKPELLRAVVSAAGWLSAGIALNRLAALLKHSSPAARAIGIAGHAIRRLNPGTALEKALNDPDLVLRASALKLVGVMGFAFWLPLLKKHLGRTDLCCRFHAAWSTARIAKDPGAIAELQTIALTESRYRLRSVDMVARCLDVPAAQKWLTMLASLPGNERLAIHGMAALGDPIFVPRLLEWMKQPPLLRIAGEAFTFISGAPIVYSDLEGEQPEGFEPGPSEDPLDEAVSMDPDEGLPWPNPAKVEAWWKSNQGRYSKGTRYLYGKPISPEWLQEVIAKERQRQRLAAALELAIRQPKEPLLELRAPYCTR
jgi:uncharacterized protein (TIGR02270 family)